MTRPSPHIVYVGKANCAAEAVPCFNCRVAIGTACINGINPGKPHRIRVELAEAIGLVDVQPAPVFDDDATRALR
jgi:hypothetical protein